MTAPAAPKVVVIGAGLSGLCCALRLQELGCKAVIVDPRHRVGGRVSTESSDGYLIDRGFQILLTAYPEARRRLDFDRLRLRRFPSAAKIFDGQRFRQIADPVRHPLVAVGSLFDGTVGLREVGALVPRVISALLRRPDSPTVTGRSVRDAVAPSMRPSFVDGFLRSFFGGVFLDRSLGTDVGQFEFCLRMFAAGAAAIPAGGMAEIPRQLAADLDPGSLRLGRRAESIAAGSVALSDGSTEQADAVVIATEQGESERLAATAKEGREDSDSERPWCSTALLAFELPAAQAGDGTLLLDGTGAGPVNHACFISAVAPTYAPTGRAIFYANVVDESALAMSDEALEDAARRQLRSWFGGASPASGGDPLADWRVRRLVRVPKALPRQHPIDLAAERPLRVEPGIHRCGDHLLDGSINGAMRGGRLAAEAVAKELGAVPKQGLRGNP